MALKNNGGGGEADRGRQRRRREAPPAAAAREGIDQAQPFDLYETPGYLVRRLHQIVVSLCYEQWGDLAISPLQYAVLMAVRAYPGIDQRGLSRAVAIDRSSIGAVSEQLDRRGFVERRVGKRDKRNKELFLSEAGAALLRRAHPIAWEIQTRLLQALDKKERGEFVRLLTKVVERNNALSRAPLDRTGFE